MIHRVRSGVAGAIGAAALTTALFTRPSGAEHFDILLQVESGNSKITAMTDTTPPIGGVNPRPVIKVKSGAGVRVTWKMSSGFPHGIMKNVTVHFFIVRQQNLGQKPVPDPSGAGSVVNNSFNMDFAPKAVAAGSVQFKSPEPGAYLVRVQSEDTHVEHDHEHFSAADILVE